MISDGLQALEYSRDAQAAVLLAMEAIATAITHGLFDPDTSRSKRWPRHGCNSLQSVMIWLAKVNAEEFWYQNQNVQHDVHVVQPDPEFEGFQKVERRSEPYSPSIAEDDDDDDAESISSVSAVSDRPDIGREYATSEEERDAEIAAPIVGENLAQDLEPQINSVVYRHLQSSCCHLSKESSTDPEDGESVILKCGKIATKNFEQVQLAGNFLPYKCSRCFAGS